MNTTKEGIEVKPGQVWLDLDKRMWGRKVRITEVLDGFAYYGKGARDRIAIRRMHTHSTGFRLAEEAK